jgi:Rieske Fe-S protein
MTTNANCGRINRRSFLNRLMGYSAAVISAGASCRTVLRGQEKQSQTLARLKIADHPNLEKVGAFVLIDDTPAGELLVIRTSESEFVSVSTICPHKHCNVRVLNSTTIRCPCHKSTYKIDGTYISGPSKASLRKFVTRVEGNIITTLEN